MLWAGQHEQGFPTSWSSNMYTPELGMTYNGGCAKKVVQAKPSTD